MERSFDLSQHFEARLDFLLSVLYGSAARGYYEQVQWSYLFNRPQSLVFFSWWIGPAELATGIQCCAR